MPLPSSGQMSVADIAANQGANSVGVVTPYSMFQLSILAGKNFVWDGTPVYYSMAVSSFYSYAGYGYKFGSPAILHDYGLSSRFSTSSSNIIDTSGNGRTGVYVNGTGNGAAINIPNGFYDTGYIANIRTIDNAQYAIRLEQTAKYGGVASFTWLTWFRVSSFQTNYPGLISVEGRNGGTPIGHTMHLSNEATRNLDYVRWNASNNTASVNRISYGVGGVPAFQFNKWYMAAVRFNGSVAVLELYIDGIRYANTVNTTNNVTTSGDWGVFNGLRYNNWLDGKFGYCAIYSSDIGLNGTATINDVTRFRYDF